MSLEKRQQILTFFYSLGYKAGAGSFFGGLEEEGEERWE